MHDLTGRADPQHLINAYWSYRGAGYDESPGHAPRHSIEKETWLEVLGRLLPDAPADVLDAGTGTGFVALLLAELGHRVTGIDLAEGMLSRARQKAAGMAQPPAFLVGDARTPDFPPGSFDVIASRHVLWTLLDPAAALERWRSLLRPGGRVVAIDGLWWADDPARAAVARPGGWNEAYSAEVRASLPLMSATSSSAVIQIARAAGFKDIRIEALDEIDAVERSLYKEQADSQPHYALIAS